MPLPPSTSRARRQQSPAPRGGGIVKWVWFQTYDVPPEKGSGDLVVQSWDTASKAKEYNDYSVCTIWLVRENRYYLLHVLRQRLGVPGPAQDGDRAKECLRGR